MEQLRSMRFALTLDTTKRNITETFGEPAEIVRRMQELADDKLLPQFAGRCATCRWAEWHLRGPAILEPIIGAAITPDLYAPIFEDFSVCRHAWMGGRFIALPPNFGCVMHEAKP